MEYGRVSKANTKDLMFAMKYVREGMVREGWGDAKFRFDIRFKKSQKMK